MCKLSLFGTPTLVCDGHPRHIQRRKAKALLIYLAVTQQSHSREALVALLWPEHDRRAGRADLSRNLSSLRKTLGADHFLTDLEIVALNQEATLWVDVVHFRNCIDACRKANDLNDEFQHQLMVAAELYQADFLAGFTLPGCPAFDEWQLLQTEALRRDLSWALEMLIRAYKNKNDLTQAIIYSHRWVALNPLHEPAQRCLIDLYARNGQLAEAHRQYQDCKRLLAEELGIEPQSDTKQLYDRIQQGHFKEPLIANRFKLLEKQDHLLGQDGLSDVYRGQDTKMDKPVAIKVTHPDIIYEHPDLLKRIEREGEALRRLDHPNIVKMHAAVIENDRHYLIMEYVSGGSLRDLLARNKSLPLSRVLEIGLGLSDALASVHQLNIIHCNIRSANILIASDGTPRLTDFGLARLSDVSQLTMAGDVLGAVGYLSPEACQGKTLDPRADIWSLGILLVEMLTGERPFDEPTTVATITAILNQPAPDLQQHYPHIPAPLADLISRMLIKNRNKRLANMRYIGAELEAIQKGGSLSLEASPGRLEQEIRYFHSFDNTRIAFAIVGSGPPVVMAATYLRHLEFEWQSPVWQHWLNALASNYTLIRYDERGCGLSDWDVKDISFEAWVRDLESLIDHLSLEHFSLIALSQGGPVAISYAGRHPEKISHLILHGSYARGRFHRDSPQAAEEAQTLLSLVRLGWGQENPAFLRVFSLQLMPEATKEQLTWFDQLMRVSMSAENAARAETEMYNINVLDLLPDLRIPTLVTHSRYDEAVPITEGRILAKQIPNAILVPLDSKNHLLLSNEPAWQKFVREVHRFVTPESQSLARSRPPHEEVQLKIKRFERPEIKPEYENPFVGRLREITQLNNHLDETLAGNGQIVFVTGGAGRGKTSLIEEFARRAQKAHADLIVASGYGNSFSGIGDPYLPFREVLRMLTGDVTTWRIGGRITLEQARRLWAMLPLTIQAILEQGPQLLDVFVSGKQLLSRAIAAAPMEADWLAALQAEVKRHQDVPGSFEQSGLFGQFTDVIHLLAQQRPLLIILDDMQWMDEASTDLLFHIGRRLGGGRIMIVGAYRMDELQYNRHGEPHPLIQVLDEFKRTYGDIFIDLAQDDESEGKAFVESLLDTEPNRLDAAFRQALFKRTRGHPLFTVELLHGMQQRGDLVQDEEGCWCEGKHLDWERFPARIEAVIARRVDWLEDSLRTILEVASVEGEFFTAEIVAHVLGMELQTLFHRLSDQLGRKHRLVGEQAEIDLGNVYLSSYQFNHALFQEYIYRQLSSGEKRRLHKAVAEGLVALYKDNLDLVVVQLADHFTAAAEWDKAIIYLRRAGDLAYQKASLSDAVRHYQDALAHWPASDVAGHARTFGKSGECLWMLGKHQEALESFQAGYQLFKGIGDDLGAAMAQRLMGRVYWELGEPGKAGNCFRLALVLSERESDNDELAWALAGMSNYYMQLENYDKSIRLGERALTLAKRLNVDTLVIQCLCDIGSALSGKGDWDGLIMERESLNLALSLNRPHDAGRAYLYFGEGLIYLGDYEQAYDLLEQAVAYTRRMNISYLTNGALRMLAEIEWLTGNWSSALDRLEALNDQASSEQLSDLSSRYLVITLGRVYNDLGQVNRAHRLMTSTLSSVDSSSVRVALLGELLRSDASIGREGAVSDTVAKILEWTEQVSYLYPNINMALLNICLLPETSGWSQGLAPANVALQQLECLNEQYRTRATAASHVEGGGWLALAEGNTILAIKSFEQATAHWKSLKHPYDQIRALYGLSRSLTMTSDKGRTKPVLVQAMDLIDSVSTQLDDPALKSSFRSSWLVQEIRNSMTLEGI